MTHTLHRTARIAVRATPGQARRCWALMVAAGDVWAWALDCNRQLRSWGLRPVVNYQALCRELAGNSFGELAQHSARRVLERYSTTWFAAAKRRAEGQRSGFPRRKRRLFVVIWQQGNFTIEGDRMRLSVARGAPPLRLRLGRAIPYPPDAIRTVTLVHEAGRLYLDVTALVPVDDHDLDPRKTAGVDPGIIHPFALATGDEALLVSGRAMRSEQRLHLADTKARASKMGRRTPKRGEPASRRYKKLRAAQKRAEARHRRRIRQAHHEASWSTSVGPHRPVPDATPGWQALRAELPLSKLWFERASRHRRSAQHRRSSRRDHEHNCARHAPSGRHGACTA